MPTFTAIAALDRLLEPRSSRNPAPNLKPPSLPAAPANLGRPASASEKKRFPLPPASPALYSTPASATTPLPDTPSSFPPSSPYVVNHKRRGPRLLKSLSQNDVGRSHPPPLPPIDTTPNGNGGDRELEEVVKGFHVEKIEDAVDLSLGIEGTGTPAVAGQEKDGDKRGDFFDTRDSISNDSDGAELLWKTSTPMGEFFDALDEITCEGTPRSFSRNVEDELCEMRLNVLMEIERRKQAEETLKNLQNQWGRLSHQLSLVGLTLPDHPPTITEETNEHSNLDPAEDLCRQVVIARFVASSIARGCSQAEIELDMEPLIESKNFEIARLWDRLQYYEAANREMSQRNQEAVEMARQQRRKRRQKWFWGSIGLTVTIGTAALAWSFLSHTKPPSSHEGDTAASHEN